MDSYGLTQSLSDFADDPNNMYFLALLRGACVGGKLKMAKWLFETFKFTKARFINHAGIGEAVVTQEISWIFFCACNSGHLGLAKLLAQELYITSQDILLSDQSVQAICAMGRVDIFEYLRSEFNVTVTDTNIRHDNNLAFCSACANGHLQMVQWLVANFHVTRFEILHGWVDQNAFCQACSHGQLSVAQWLADSLNLTATDMQPRNIVPVRFPQFACNQVYYACSHAFQNACSEGHLSTARWLASRFRMTIKNIRFNNNGALRGAAENGHLSVLQWLVDKFQLLPSDVKADNSYCSAFYMACDNGHIETARWLAITYNLRASIAAGPRANEREVFGTYNKAFYMACNDGDLEAAHGVADLVELMDEANNPVWADVVIKSFHRACQKKDDRIVKWILRRLHHCFDLLHEFKFFLSRHNADAAAAAAAAALDDLVSSEYNLHIALWIFDTVIREAKGTPSFKRGKHPYASLQEKLIEILAADTARFAYDESLRTFHLR